MIRAASAVPKHPATEFAFWGVFAVGVVAYNAAFLLAALLLGLNAWRVRGSRPALAAALAVLLLLALAAPLFGGGPWASAILAVTAAWVVAAVALRWVRETAGTPAPRWGRLREAPRVGFVVFAAAVFPLVALGYVGNATSWPGVPVVLGLAEVAAVLAACLAPWGLSCALRRRPLLAAAFAGAVVLMLAIRSPLVPLIATWSLAFSMFLPIPLYALGAAGLAYALADRLPREGLRGSAAGLLVLVVAGIGMRTTAEALLVVAGALLLFAAVPDEADVRAAEPRVAPDGETLKGSAGSA